MKNKDLPLIFEKLSQCINTIENDGYIQQIKDDLNQTQQYNEYNNVTPLFQAADTLRTINNYIISSEKITNKHISEWVYKQTNQFYTYNFWNA